MYTINFKHNEVIETAIQWNMCVRVCACVHACTNKGLVNNFLFTHNSNNIYFHVTMLSNCIVLSIHSLLQLRPTQTIQVWICKWVKLLLLGYPIVQRHVVKCSFFNFWIILPLNYNVIRDTVVLIFFFWRLTFCK